MRWKAHAEYTILIWCLYENVTNNSVWLLLRKHTPCSRRCGFAETMKKKRWQNLVVYAKKKDGKRKKLRWKKRKKNNNNSFFFDIFFIYNNRRVASNTTDKVYLFIIRVSPGKTRKLYTYFTQDRGITVCGGGFWRVPMKNDYHEAPTDRFICHVTADSQ